MSNSRGAFTDFQPFCREIWEKKYRFKDEVDQYATCARVVKAVMASEPMYFQEAALNLMGDAIFVPGGRIIAGAGTGRGVTLHNCLGGETLILTGEYGLVPIGEIVGETVHVLDGDGKWVVAPVNYLGEQDLAPIVLRGGYNGHERKIIRATAGHRWILQDGQERTTTELEHGCILKMVQRRDVEIDAAYLDGVCHGIVYGDGTRYSSSGYQVRLCGSKVELSRFFEARGWVKFCPQSFEDDIGYRMTRADLDLKVFPIDASIRYLTGFLRGWLATDGSVDRRDRKAIISCGIKEVEWLRVYGPVAGMEVAYANKLSESTNYGQRNKEIYNASLRRWTLISEDFLLSKHRELFKSASYPWIVEDIGEFQGEAEPVFCPRVTTTGSVQLDLGVHTGQCYVMGTLDDSLDGIFSALRESALTMQQGGGIGVDFSTLRPKGAWVSKVDSDASGPLSFADVWDSMCKTIISAGERRGAMMMTLRCDHPDIEEFIEAKRQPGRLTQFNMSVLVTDGFMHAVKNDYPWHLWSTHARKDGAVKTLGAEYVYKTVQARDLWKKIIQTTYDYAEPGVIFIDRMNDRNNLSYCEVIATTNPCGEQPLPPYGDCCLGAINLAQLVKNPWTSKAFIDYGLLCEAVTVGVRFLDNVIDVTAYPLIAQDVEAKDKRRIGLGVMGLANMLQQVGLRYGSPASVSFVSDIFEKIANAAYVASADLANEKGRFPLYNRAILDSPNVRQLSAGTRAKIDEHGLRNGVLLTVAPTGTTGIFAGNVAGGIEPVFAHSYVRNVRQPDGSTAASRVYDWGYLEYCRHHNLDAEEELNQPSPNFMVTHEHLSVDDHLAVMAAAQKWVDASISKTINCPAGMPFDDFSNVYWSAYDLGCKSCTTYRPNPASGRGAVLELDKKTSADDVEEKSARSTSAVPASALSASEAQHALRPDALPGVTYKIKPGEHAYYITITDLDGRPHELFIQSKESQFSDWTAALGRMISAIWRRGGDTSFIAEELRQIHSPQGGWWENKRYVPSMVAAIGNIIDRHTKIKGGDRHEPEGNRTPDDIHGRHVDVAGTVHPDAANAKCPRCQSYTVRRTEGCLTCAGCGWSNCG